MKHRFKTFLVSAVASICLMTNFAVIPVAARGDSTGDGGDDKKVTTQSSNEFCSKLTTATDKISSEVNKKKDELDKKKTEKSEKLKESQNEWAKKLTEFRTKEDTTRAENFGKLDELAKTDQQKAAVAAYKQAILAAVAARRTGHDTNQQTFLNAVKTLVSSNKQEVDNDKTVFANAVNAAIANAKASCAAGVPTNEVKAKLQSDLKSAREKFKTERKDDESMKGKIKALNETRREADKKVKETFKTATEIARETLKAAFPQTDE